jgi:hypothetical protein
MPTAFQVRKPAPAAPATVIKHRDQVPVVRDPLGRPTIRYHADTAVK